MPILVKKIKNPKISILVKIVEKSQIWWNLSKNLDFSQNCWIFLILVKIYQNVDFGKKKKKNFDVGQNCRKFSILVKNYQNVDFGPNGI